MEISGNDLPERLKGVKPAVNGLYYRGDVRLLNNNNLKLAVVGSRKMTDYGLTVIDKWVPALVEKGVVIVSGFMYGVDHAAHLSCMENGGKTIAVLGWGIERKISWYDQKLYEKFIENGSLIVSEYGGDRAAEKWTFPQRNRIVVGLSEAILVVEGELNSGSMITAKWAVKLGKKLLAVPGPVTSRLSEGTNDLIRCGLARAVTCAEDVWEVLNLGVGK